MHKDVPGCRAHNPCLFIVLLLAFYLLLQQEAFAFAGTVTGSRRTAPKMTDATDSVGGP